MEQKESQLRKEYVNLKAELEDPAIYSSKEYPALAKRQKELEDVISLFDSKSELTKHLQDAHSMADGADAEMAELAKNEVSELQVKITQVNENLNEALIPKDPNDERDCIVEIRGAAGGDEAALFAGDLYRMYSRWCERNGYKTELISESPSDAGGQHHRFSGAHHSPAKRHSSKPAR
jgi:peptide chain release factor 1